VDDEYKTTQQLIDQHKGVLGKAKSNYETLKKTVNELHGSEVLLEVQMLERVALLEAQMEKMDPNLNSISDYREKLSKYNGRVEELTLVMKECDETKKHYDRLEKEKMITLGGDAKLNIFEILLY
ncbi:hypothetical protein Tco_1239105, partial [Tanacetum coccineum]